MNLGLKLLSKLAEGLQDGPHDPDEEFVRDVVFSDDELEKYASILAAEHTTSNGVGQSQLILPRFIADRLSLLTTCRKLAFALDERHEISPAAKCLVTELQTIEEQLRSISHRLTRSYYSDFPKLESGPLAGYPRIYAIALALTNATNGSLDPEVIKRFIRSYQRTSPLTIHELSALEITLKLALLGTLNRLAARISSKELEDEWQGATKEWIVNIITSLRLLSEFACRELFLSVSVVDLVLSNDPAGAYSRMDFPTRDRYLRIVGRIAKRTGATEIQVAQHAIKLASSFYKSDSPERTHVGYYLIDNGLPELEKEFNYRMSLAEQLTRVATTYPAVTYLGTATLFTALIVATCLNYGLGKSSSLLTLFGVSLLVLVPASELGLGLLNLIVIGLFPQRILPKMDTSLGIPNDAMTMIVVPTIYSSEAEVRELLERIETHYLANQDNNLFFALLGDLSDAPQKEMPEDKAILIAAISGIKKLNERYSLGIRDRFYEFHRGRLWNQGEKKWMGWERKRGKLQEFNQLLRGACDTSYLESSADLDFRAQIRYVITVDSDTHLPRDAARRLIGTILHPLNQPQLDANAARVVRGYGVLQPRICISPPKAKAPRIPKLLSGYVGGFSHANPYIATVPIVYQNLFDESNYVGKGLYEVDIFNSVLKDRIPANLLLSHDVLEGLYARTALVADVEVLDDPIFNYAANSKRNHRWCRGDWQLLPWLFPRVRESTGDYVHNVLPLIGRWKILDNMRRSLFSITTLLWLIGSWTVLSGSPLLWTVFALLILLLPVYLHYSAVFLLELSETHRTSPWKNAWYAFKTSTSQVLLVITCLAHRARITTDAITRTLFRLFFSHRHLLEWVAASQIQKESRLTPWAFWRYMWPAVATALVGALLVAINRASLLILAAPFLLAWLVSPLVAYRKSLRMQTATNSLEKSIETDVRLNARCLWRLFETSADNPRPAGGDRTILESSTLFPKSRIDVARLLLWTMAASDLGTIGTIELAERIEAPLGKLQKTEGFDADCIIAPCQTPGFESLRVAHIINSESGSLAGHLRALTESLNDVTVRPLFDRRVIDGVTDTILLMSLEAENLRIPLGKNDTILMQLNEEIRTCQNFLYLAAREEYPQGITAWKRFFETLAQRGAILEVMLQTLSLNSGLSNVDEMRYWTNFLTRQAQSFNRDLQRFAPWTSVRLKSLAPIIRRHSASDHARWNDIIEDLDRVSPISSLPANLETLLTKLTELYRQFAVRLSSDGIERRTVLNGCVELMCAIEGALRASSDVCSRYACLANSIKVVTDSTNFYFLFDEEHKRLRSQFQTSMRY